MAIAILGKGWRHELGGLPRGAEADKFVAALLGVSGEGEFRSRLMVEGCHGLVTIISS